MKRRGFLKSLLGTAVVVPIVDKVKMPKIKINQQERLNSKGVRGDNVLEGNEEAMWFRVEVTSAAADCGDIRCFRVA